MSSLRNSFLQVSIKSAIEIYKGKIIPDLIKKNKTTSISAAIVLSLFYFIYDQVLKPPRNLRHIPYFGYFSILKTLIKQESLIDRGKNVNVEFVKTRPDGLYLELAKVGWEVQVSNPEDIKHILLKHELFPKIFFSEGFEETLVNKFMGRPNLFTTEGEEWKSLRKVFNPAFRRSMPVKLFGNITKQLFARIEGPEKTVEVSDLMMRCTLEAIGKAAFGFNFEAISKENSEWTKVYTKVSDGIQDIKYFLFPMLDQEFLWLFPKRKAIHRELDTLTDMLDEVIQNKRELLKRGELGNDHLEENERDILTLMLESEEKGEDGLSNKDIQANICLLFFGGHDTTKAALSFALYYLAKYPEIQERARNEANLILGEELEDIIPTVEEAKQMKYIDQVVKETLRIKNPVPRLTPRLATEDTFLSGTFIPKGSRITININDMQHSEKIWENPNQFDPDRFAQENDNFSWVPFGYGARQCIGINFSLNEQRVMLAMILRKYILSLPENSPDPDDLPTSGAPIVAPSELYITFNKRY